MTKTTHGTHNFNTEPQNEQETIASRVRAGDGGEPNSVADIQKVRREVWERIKEKSERYEETDIVSAFPPLSHFGADGVWVGGFTRTIPSKKWRLFLEPSVVSEGGAVATPPQLTRAYLDQKFPKQLRAKKSQLDFWKDRRSQPMYTEPGKYNKEMVYLDLKSAYWSIVRVIGWDVDYFPGMLVRQRGCDDFPFAGNRLARNSLVSLGLPSHGFLYLNGRFITVPHSWRVNLGLWSAVQDILHGVADDMIKRAGAVYVNTDGYILPAAHEAIAREIGAEWGLEMGEKNRGRATVYGVGAYSIGGYICPRGRRFASSVQAVRPRHKDKLKRYFRFLSDRYGKRTAQNG